VLKSQITTEQVIQTSNLLTTQLQLPEHDVLILGDGSGTTIDKPCGWAVWLHFLKTGRAIRLFGGLSGGTNNMAELLPYIQALNLLDYIVRKALDGKPYNRTTRVCIVTDSELTAKCGNGEYGRNYNQGLWASVDWFNKNGFHVTFHHVRRNTNPVSAACDELAGEVRSVIENWPLDK